MRLWRSDPLRIPRVPSTLISTTRLLRGARSRAYRLFGNASGASALMQDRLRAEPWFIDSIDAGEGRIGVSGWSFPVAGNPPTRFFHNDVAFGEVRYPLPRKDVAEIFWQRRNAVDSGFACTSSAVDEIYPDGVLKISRSSDADELSRGRDVWFLPDPALHADLPDEERRFRVIGNRDAAGFLNTGATDFHRLDAVARTVAGKPLWEHGNVLDWGVGCGRLARHFPSRATGRLCGCDIDHDNAQWCARHLAGTFVASSMEPPLPFPADCFDLVYGISIFTHLKEPLQLRWLQELARVCKERALVLTTVHGETAVEFFRLLPTQYRRLKREMTSAGLLVTSGNTQLDGHVDHGGEYVNVFHSEDYVRQRWSEHFEIVAIIPGYIFTHDLVVMRRRAKPRG